MKKLPIAIFALFALHLLPASPAGAQDFSEGSQAKSWGLLGEEPARFEAKVVDILCELTGDCPANRGDGRRQLGLLRSDGVLVLPTKNGQPIFTGAATDLAPFCGQDVEVDGLMVGEDIPAKLYQVQLIRPAGEGEWQKTNRWTTVWNAENPEAAKAEGPWFRKDPRILSRIEDNGYFGLGKEADEAFIKEWQ